MFMPVDLNPLYIDNPEPIDGFIGSPYGQTVPDMSFTSPDAAYASSADPADKFFDTKHTEADPRVKLPRKSKSKGKSAIITAASTLVAASIGGLSIINPLTNRPSLKKESYSLVNRNELHYSFSFSATKNYVCGISLYLEENLVEELPLEEAKTYEGQFILKQSGTYRLYFDATNKVDYRIHQLKYTITFTEE